MPRVAAAARMASALNGPVAVELDLAGVAPGLVEPGPAGDGLVDAEVQGQRRNDLLG